MTATDDGKRCVESGVTIDPNNTHTSTAKVVVFITDVNDNRPVFNFRGMNAPKIEAGAPSGSLVIKVNATDEDKGVNGQVKYSIMQPPMQNGTKFTIDEETGELFTNKVFGPDDGKTVSVIVKATDSGVPSLERFSSFTVEITNVNDSPAAVKVCCLYPYEAVILEEKRYTYSPIITVSTLYQFRLFCLISITSFISIRNAKYSTFIVI